MLAEGRAEAKTIRQEKAWCVRGTGRRLLCLERMEKDGEVAGARHREDGGVRHRVQESLKAPVRSLDFVLRALHS